MSRADEDRVALEPPSIERWLDELAALLPPGLLAFSGELRVGSDGLILDGRYVPPFGRVGLVIDAALLHLVARRTAQAFLARIAARISS